MQHRDVRPGLLRDAVLRDRPIGAASWSCPGRRRDRRRIAPRADRARPAEVGPDFLQRLEAKISAHERQGVDELDQSIGKHDQQRGRMLQIGSATPRAALTRENRRACGRGTHRSFRAGMSKKASYCRLRQFQVPPCFDGIARVHRAAGVEAVGTQLEGQVDCGADFMGVEVRGREIDLDRGRPRCGGCARPPLSGRNSPRTRMRLKVRLEAPSRLTCTALTPRRLHAFAVFGGQVVAVGLDLELRAARADVLRPSRRTTDGASVRRPKTTGRGPRGPSSDRGWRRLVPLSSSSTNALPGPLSSMQWRQARLHSLVICHAT